MRPVVIVTGPLRSGTSCITGLLEACGFDLGANVRVLRNPTSMNPRGHFEPDLLFTINERLLVEAGAGGIVATDTLPPPALPALMEKRERYFSLFIRKFDGELCKDPLLCFTLGGWRRHWPALGHAIFCVRNPPAVAASMARRYGIPERQGQRLWAAYSRAFMAGSAGLNVYWLDFDHFCHDPLAGLENLLHWLRRPLPREALSDRVAAFFIPPGGDAAGLFGRMPDADIALLYQQLAERARASRERLSAGG